MILFQERLRFDEELVKRVESAVNGDIDTSEEVDRIITIAKDAGFDITTGDLLKSQALLLESLSDEELESVAGGTYKLPPAPGVQRTGSLNFGGGCGIPGDKRNTGWGRYTPGFGYW